MELDDKTELLRRLSFYVLSKINLGRYGLFHKILLVMSWDINLNQGPLDSPQNENVLKIL